MKFKIKQKLASVGDAYDIFDERGEKVYFAQQGVGIKNLEMLTITITDANDNKVAELNEKVNMRYQNDFEITVNDEYVGTAYHVHRRIVDQYKIDEIEWSTSGRFNNLKVEIVSPEGTVAKIHKKRVAITDTYDVDVKIEKDVLVVLAFIIAIDAINRDSPNDNFMG